MTGLIEREAAFSSRRLWERLPVVPELLQSIVAETPQKYIVGRGVLRMQLEAVAFKPLREIGLTSVSVHLMSCCRDRIAETRKTAVLLPVLAEPATDALVRLGKTPLLSRLRSGCLFCV